MHRFLVLLLCAGVGAAGQSSPEFEVATVKPTAAPTPENFRAGTARVAFNVVADRVDITGYTPLMLVTRAFRVEAPQVDAPASARQFFEVRAKMPEGATEDQIPEMLQALLAERFQLAYHRETREYRVTALTVGKDGVKLERLPDGTEAAVRSERLAGDISRTTTIGPVSSMFAVMDSFGGFPQVVDQTGLDGMYTWVRYMPPAALGMTYQERVQESFRAMIEAAGLQLEERTVPRETIVIDHLEEMPTAN